MAQLNQILSTLLSRNFTLAGDGDERAIQSNVQLSWRLIISAGVGSDIQAEITVSNMSSSYTIQSCIPRGGASDFTGFGAVEIKIKNTTATPVEVNLSLDRQPTERPEYQYCTPTQNITAAWSDLDSAVVNGYAPPFCEHVRIFASADINLRFLDSAGAVVGSFLGLVPESTLLNKIHLPPFAKIQIQSVGAAANCMAVYF